LITWPIAVSLPPKRRCQWRLRAVVVGREDPAARGVHAEPREIAAGRELAAGDLGRVVDAHVELLQLREREEIAERSRLVAQPLKNIVGGRSARDKAGRRIGARRSVEAVIHPGPRGEPAQEDEFLRSLHRQGTQEHVVDQAEQRGVRADAEGE